MHTLKVVLLALSTLAVMRVVSWALAWPLLRWCRYSRGSVVVTSNAAGLLLFLGFLRWDHLPGEFLDYSAASFGLVTYAVFALIDCKWHLWNYSRLEAAKSKGPPSR